MKKYISLFLLILVSAGISAFLMPGNFGVEANSRGPADIYFVFVLPGLFFGLAGAAYSLLFSKDWSDYAAIPAWVGASVGSYIIASFMIPFMLAFSSPYHVGTFLQSGLVGGVLMLLGWRFFIQKINWSLFPPLVLLAGVLGALPSLVLGASSNILFRTIIIVWQLGMGIAMGAAMHCSEKRSAVGQQL